MPELQPRLFEDLPPTREETPVHQLNYPTFAGAENTMWHGRLRGAGGLTGGPLWDDTVAQKTGWKPEGENPVHVGTFEAASHRALGEDRARLDSSTPEHGYRPREELVEVAGVHREGIGFGTSNQTSAQMLPFRVREERMFNTPDMPVSDAYANLASGGGDIAYGDEYATELVQAGVVEDEDVIEGIYSSIGDVPEEHMPEPISMTGGLYYRNEHEDPGSVSAVVDDASALQHWPTEVLEHSTNPAQRRTAEFLRGRGY